MGAQKQERPLPLRLLDYINGICGAGLWESIEKYRTEHQGEWDDRCYIPIAPVSDLIMEYDQSLVDRTNAGTIAALAGWRRCKEIYRFDPDFAALLMEDADDNVLIPYDALRQLPYNCFYVDAPIMDYDGFFVYYEHDVESDIMELRMDAVSRAMPTFASGISLHLVGETLADGIEESIRFARKSYYHFAEVCGEERANRVKRDFERLNKLFVPKAIQLVLYLCAENAEVAENAEQKAITRRTPVIKDQFREIRKWDVGADAGIRIRRFRTSQASGAERSKHGSHASPTPHMRRAHWHRFWTGKRDTDERKLVLRWIPPTFVAGDGQAEAPTTTINQV